MTRLLRFFGVQTVGTAADFLLTLALYSFLGLAGTVASTLGFLTGTIINYFGHHHVTFSTGDGAPATFSGFFRYLLAVLMSLVVRLAVLIGFGEWTSVPFWLALATAFVASFVCSYLFSLLWVFRRST